MLLGVPIAFIIRKKIIAGHVCANDPDVLMSRMLTALVSASFMVTVASLLALSLLTPYTITSSITGFSIAAKGLKSVIW